MIPVPAALVDAYGRAVWSARTLATFTDPAGRETSDVAITAGSLTRSEDAYPRSVVDLELPTAVTPSATAPPVSPYGGRVALRAELTLAQGGTFTVPLGTFDVVETNVDRPDGIITVRAASPEARVADYGWSALDAPVPAGTLVDLVTTYVRAALPAVPVRASVGTINVPSNTFREAGDRWAVVEELCDAYNAEAWFDVSGQLIIRPVPTKTSSPVTTFTIGTDGTVLAYASTRGWAPNRYRTRFRTDPNDGSAEAFGVGSWDVTTGPLAYTGPYGTHYRWTDDRRVYAIPSQSTMNNTARNRGRRALARLRSTTLNVVPCPWVEPGDTVRVAMLGDLVEDHLVVSYTLDLSFLSDMIITTRDPDYPG